MPVTISLLLAFTLSSAGIDSDIHFRYNQLGYLPADAKVAVAFSNVPLDGAFELWKEGGDEAAFSAPVRPAARRGWGSFKHYYELDFSTLQQPGNYQLRIGEASSRDFPISSGGYASAPADLLTFMQQQRCGYNPYLDMVCHQRDGRIFYGKLPDSTYVDVSGGWHDAGDQLKYLITSSFATGSMLLAYEIYPESFGDLANHLGQPHPNGLADVLDEARWGLDWIHKCHFLPDQLVHQVADDRDHSGWKWPDRDSSNYGWGPNSYRTAYVASGHPQGLRKYQSKATGVANVTGRSAAAMALGYRAFRERDAAYAGRCLQAARQLYAMGRAREGYQQGNSHGAPYRYNEDTWADDMEWAAAELYAATGEAHYLEEAKQYARQIGTTSWMPLDTADHYRLYPFINLGHYALHAHVDDSLRDTLAVYYRQGIEACLARGERNLYRIGVPFIWCSNNLVTALITQIILYERMTGDRRYHDFMLAQRDWLLGRNPWGTSMFTGMPRNGEYPLDVHTSVWKMTVEVVPGGTDRRPGLRQHLQQPARPDADRARRNGCFPERLRRLPRRYRRLFDQ